MSNYVLKYTRDDRVKYISHLDFVRTFHRTVRRANLDMTFSQGFNPHPVMTVAMPLSVGVTSDGEYMKIGFDGDYSEKEIMERLNDAFPEGFRITAVKRTEGKELDFALLDRAVYTVAAECNDINLFSAEKFLENNELAVMKKSKSGVKEADVRPYIYDLYVLEQKENMLILKMCIAAGNNYNLKPDTVIDAMEKYTKGFKVSFFSVNRDKILAGDRELL